MEKFLLLLEQGVLFLESLGQVGDQGDVVHGVEVHGTVVGNQEGQDIQHFLGDEAGMAVGQGGIHGELFGVVVEGDRPEGADGRQGGRQVEDVFLDPAVGGSALAVGGDALGANPSEGLGGGAEDELAGSVGFNVSGEVIAGFVEGGGGDDDAASAGSWGLGVVVDGKGTFEVVGGVDEEFGHGYFQ